MTRGGGSSGQVARKVGTRGGAAAGRNKQQGGRLRNGVAKGGGEQVEETGGGYLAPWPPVLLWGTN